MITSSCLLANENYSIYLLEAGSSFLPSNFETQSTYLLFLNNQTRTERWWRVRIWVVYSFVISHFHLQSFLEMYVRLLGFISYYFVPNHGVCSENVILTWAIFVAISDQKPTLSLKKTTLRWFFCRSVELKQVLLYLFQVLKSRFTEENFCEFYSNDDFKFSLFLKALNFLVMQLLEICVVVRLVFCKLFFFNKNCHVFFKT